MTYPPEKTPEQEAAALQVQEAILKKMEELHKELGPETLELALEGGISKWNIVYFVANQFQSIVLKSEHNKQFDKNSSKDRLKHISQNINECSTLMQVVYTLGQYAEPEGGDAFGGMFGGGFTSKIKEMADWKNSIQQAHYRMEEAEAHLAKAAKLFQEKHPEVEKED